MIGLTNKYIENLVHILDISNSFKGAFSSDNIPLFSDYNVSLICNLSKSNEKGSHFVAIYIKSDRIFYFDPLGLQCVVKEICDYLKIYNKRIIHSLRAIQHPMSFHCGYFCTGFILAMSKKYSLIQFQNLFTPTKLLENDKIICDFIISSLHSH